MQEYFAELKPRAKREQEERSFQELLEDYKVQDVASAFEWVRKNGSLGKNSEPVHSPMAYLAVSMAQVMTRVGENQRRETAKKENSRASQETKEQENLEKYKSEAEWQAKEDAFTKAFPTPVQQETYFADYKKQTKVKFEKALLRSMAILHWSQQNQQSFQSHSFSVRSLHG